MYLTTNVFYNQCKKLIYWIKVSNFKNKLNNNTIDFILRQYLYFFLIPYNSIKKINLLSKYNSY